MRSCAPLRHSAISLPLRGGFRTFHSDLTPTSVVLHRLVRP
jgi:hypothetical protein